MGSLSRTTLRCCVCGFTEIRTDVAFDRGYVLLASCGRCEHRWTSRSEPPYGLERPAAARVRLAPEADVAFA
ncbi:MAG TPA: hypothetical protein VMW35_20640 [Myxococcota bacterium]|jgi:hypothetical protein|nr:hypothetical protein [Myxococcota bacterium]